jgi:hypothetical protein
MKKLIFIIVLTISITFLGFSENQIVLEGIYQGENVFVMNPFSATGVGFCIFEVTVNGEITTDEINSSAFEIDLSALDIEEGETVKIIIKHKDGCTPKVLNSEVLNPKSTFNVEAITVSKDGTLKWSTTGERGVLTFTVEQYKWNKWIKVESVEGKGTSTLNNYSCKVSFNTGENKFRVKQIDYTKKARYSDEVTYTSLAATITFLPGDGKKAIDKITFSATTSYEIYDYFGRLQLKGEGLNVDITSLTNGSYFLNYDNATATFEKK